MKQNIISETKKIPIIAGMPLGKKNDYKLREVGYKVVKFTYDSINYQNGHTDKMLIKEKEIKRVFY